jgi:hypothetical protein
LAEGIFARNASYFFPVIQPCAFAAPAAVLLVEVFGDVVSKAALAEGLIHKAESVLTGLPIFRRAFDYLAVADNLGSAEILKSRFEALKALRARH